MRVVGGTEGVRSTANPAQHRCSSTMAAACRAGAEKDREEMSIPRRRCAAGFGPSLTIRNLSGARASSGLSPSEALAGGTPRMRCASGTVRWRAASQKALNQRGALADAS